MREAAGASSSNDGERSEQADHKPSDLEEVVTSTRSGIAVALIKSLRLHQWAKNLLIFVPLVLAGKVLDFNAWFVCFLGFVSWGILASSTYLVNDLFDLPFDRRHWSKRERPLACGDLPILVAMMVVPLGVLLSFAITASINPGAVTILILYGALTLTYSFRLKRVPMLDVFILAVLFTFRLVFGAYLANVTLSPWLLVFSMVVFTSLSFAKRYTEVGRNGALGRDKVDGRGYYAKDAPLLFGLGLATAASAVLIMVLYLINEAFIANFYNSPALLWPMPAILFLWLGRIWLLAGRDKLDDDPLQFAVRDVISLALGAAMVISYLVAWQL